MMKLYLFSSPEQDAMSRPVQALLKSYCRNFGIHWVDEIEEANGVIFYGQSFRINKPSIFVPCVLHHRIPHKVSVNLRTSLPAPDQCMFYQEEKDLVFSGDIFQFLVGQLYRAEEYLAQHRDESLHGQSKCMLGETFKFFDRPVCDLWMKFLFEHLFAEKLEGNALCSVWGRKGPSVWLTHDVDIMRHWTPKRSLWQVANLPIKVWSSKGRRETFEMIRSWREVSDPRDCLAKITALEEKIPSNFFFLGLPHDHLGPRYDMVKNRYQKSLKAVVAKGKEVGLHGSPLHLDKENTLPREADRFRQVFEFTPLHSRQHFLMWDIRKTPHWQVEVGLQTDSTLGFNNRSGFRCGTAMPFLWYDLENNEELSLLQIPLIIADHQLHGFYRQGRQAVLDELNRYYRHSSKGQGILTALFHNMYFSGIEYPEFGEIYSEWLDELSVNFTQFHTAGEIRRSYFVNELK